MIIPSVLWGHSSRARRLLCLHGIICRCHVTRCPSLGAHCTSSERQSEACPGLVARARRYARIADLDAEERIGNPLRQMRVEYAVRGKFLMSEKDKFGRHATYCVFYKTMLRDVPNEVQEEIEVFEGDMVAFRNEEEGEEGEEGDGEESEDEQP